MKKITLFLMLAFLTWPAHAGTDQKTIDFLEELNGHYYCLSREGLTSFSAQVSFAFTPAYEKAFPAGAAKQAFLSAMDQMKFSVSCAANGTPVVTLVPPPSTGNSQLDAAVLKTAQGLSTSVQGYLQCWTEIVLKPLHDQETYNGGCTLQNGSDGFRVLETSPHGTVMEYFDGQANLYASSGTYDNHLITDQSVFSKTAKGLVLSDLTVNMGGVKSAIDYQYQTVARFLMLNKVTCGVFSPQLPGGSLSFILTFSNYELNY